MHNFNGCIDSIAYFSGWMRWSGAQPNKSRSTSAHWLLNCLYSPVSSKPAAHGNDTRQGFPVWDVGRKNPQGPISWFCDSFPTMLPRRFEALLQYLDSDSLSILVFCLLSGSLEVHCCTDCSVIHGKYCLATVSVDRGGLRYVPTCKAPGRAMEKIGNFYESISRHL